MVLGLLAFLLDTGVQVNTSSFLSFFNFTLLPDMRDKVWNNLEINCMYMIKMIFPQNDVDHAPTWPFMHCTIMMTLPP